MVNVLNEFMNNELPNLLNSGYVDNEYGLQFELGYYLRKCGYNVFFERNVSLLQGILLSNFPKKEIDLYVEKDGKRYAIELKYPLSKNSGGTAEIYHFVNDICFTECLKSNGVESYCITLTDSEEYTTRKTREDANPLWNSFRGNCNNNSITAFNRLPNKITQEVKKQNGDVSKKTYNIKGNYEIVWHMVEGKWYYIIKAQ